jgi:hypothetical protein
VGSRGLSRCPIPLRTRSPGRCHLAARPRSATRTTTSTAAVHISRGDGLGVGAELVPETPVSQIDIRVSCEQCVLVGELLGYARVSTLEQDAALQHDALNAAGCFRSWTDTASGALADRPESAGGDGRAAAGGHWPGLGGGGDRFSVVEVDDRLDHPGWAVGVPHLRLPGGVLCYLDTPRARRPCCGGGCLIW